MSLSTNMNNSLTINYIISDNDISNKSILIQNINKIIIELLAIDTTYISNNYIEFINDSRPIINNFANLIQEYNNMKITYNDERINSTIPNLKQYVDTQLNIIKLSYNKIIEQSNLVNIYNMIYLISYKGNKIFNNYMCDYIDSTVIEIKNIKDKVNFSFLKSIEDNINSFKKTCYTNNIISNYSITNNVQLYTKFIHAWNTADNIASRFSIGILNAQHLSYDIIEYKNNINNECFNFLLQQLLSERTVDNPIINIYIFWEKYIHKWNNIN